MKRSTKLRRIRYGLQDCLHQITTDGRLEEEAAEVRTLCASFTALIEQVEREEAST
jgi:hypothetical protein